LQVIEVDNSFMSGDNEIGKFFFHRITEAVVRKKWKRLLITIALFAALIFALWIAQKMGIANYSAGS
jgi:hypothetical protein